MTCTAQNTCQSCVNNTYVVLVSSGDCVLCSSINANWATCSGDGAGNYIPLSCISQFYLDSSSGTPTCTNCTVSNAAYLTCTSPTFALTCNPGYYFVADDCLGCTGINPTWLTCNDASTPTACIDNTYYLDSNACNLCSGITVGGNTNIVVTCNSSTIHVSCIPTYFPDNTGTCFSCNAFNPAFVACTSSTVATDCSSGYYLDGSSCPSCTAIHASCQVCTDNPGAACTSCASNFFVSSGSCAACSSHCTACTNETVCNTC